MLILKWPLTAWGLPVVPLGGDPKPGPAPERALARDVLGPFGAVDVSHSAATERFGLAA